MIQRSLSIVLIASLMCLTPVAAAPQDDAETAVDVATGEPARVQISDNPQIFRRQLLQFLHETEVALLMALDHPAVGPSLREKVAGSPLQLPLPPEAYAAIQSASVEELEILRDAFAQAPDSLAVGAALIGTLERMPAMDEPSAKADCDTNDNEWAEILGKTNVLRGLTRTSNSLDLVHSILKTIFDAFNAAGEDVPIIGSKSAIAPAIIAGVVELIQLVMAFASDEIGYQITDSELCLASCLKDVDDVHDDGSQNWRGKGCDNRDNNCADGIDEPAEDLFPPSISVDPSLLLQCHASLAAADAAARLAIVATDDCSAVRPTIDVLDAGCTGTLSVQAEDANGNPAMVGPLSLKVDGDGPSITTPSLDACYPTLAAARDALAQTPVFDACSTFETSIGVVEKECVADLALEAVDACDNRSRAVASVRVDGSPPQVKIDELSIPTVDGLACFGSEAAAVGTVALATRFSDNCSSVEDLTPTTVAAGDACNLVVTSSGRDECGLFSSDSLVVRVDDEPPMLSCSVAIDLLDPADDQMVDVGFTLEVADNCDGATPDIEVFVTSDEATRFDYTAMDGVDPYPDAIVTRTLEGGVESIQLRAQRNPGQQFDGRVYRIRVVATDSCGLSRQTDCYVTVPPVPGPPASAVNSGQEFDATAVN